MKLYNSLTRSVEEVRLADGTLRMYVCGVTPYDTTHLGHAFSYATFDVIYRYFRFRDVPVRYIQNVTDIDDDILRKSRQVGIPWDELGNTYTAVHQASLQALNILPPERYTRATEEIPMMIEIIDALLSRGYAYRSGANVYFRVASVGQYGELSRLSSQEMAHRLNETGDKTSDPNKERPLDFVLWLGNRPGEPSWESPWGPGRPGWHIECSAMAIRHLGPALDIHGGGLDLLYPHHENEIAQSESYSGVRPFARTWVHNGMLKLGSEKMSKSLGNLVLAQELLDKYSANGLRLYLHAEHYRSSFSYEEAKLADAERRAGRLTEAAGLPDGEGSALVAHGFRDKFLAALEDDLDTPRAVAVLDELGEAIVSARSAGSSIAESQSELRELAELLGVQLNSAGAR